MNFTIIFPEKNLIQISKTIQIKQSCCDRRWAKGKCRQNLPAQPSFPLPITETHTFIHLNAQKPFTNIYTVHSCTHLQSLTFARIHMHAIYTHALTCTHPIRSYLHTYAHAQIDLPFTLTLKQSYKTLWLRGRQPENLLPQGMESMFDL